MRPQLQQHLTKGISTNTGQVGAARASACSGDCHVAGVTAKTLEELRLADHGLVELDHGLSQRHDIEGLVLHAPDSQVVGLHGTGRPKLMIVARHKGAAFADQEVEVHTFVGLQYMVHIQLPVATGQRRGRGAPGGQAAA